MARDSNLTDDLEALAEEERQGLGDPPSIEQLIALRDGELPEDEAERFRDRIAVDPESATVYLELKRSADLEPAGETAAAVSPAAVDDAWEKLAPSLRADAPGSARPEGNAYRVLPFPRRGWWGRVFGVAAVLALAVGLVWLLTERGPRSQPDGDYHEVSITQAELRDNRLEVPEEAPGITFQIDAPALDASGEVVVELLDSSGRVIRRQEVAIEAGQRQLDFDVASRSLEEGRSYRLVVRRIDASTADRPWIDVVFAPVFVPAPKTGGMPAPDTCEAIDKQVSVTAERRQAGDRRAAEESYNDLLERSRTHGCPVQEARIWSGLATPVILEGRLLEGLRLLERADDVLSSPAAKAATDFEDEANWAKAAIELSRGTAYSRLGWLPDARQALAEARALYRRDGTDARRWARVLLQLARVYRLEGDVDEARETIREAQGWARETEDWKLRAAVWQESARLDIESGRLDAAERALDRAVAAIEKADELARANVLADVAELRARQGRWAESLRLVEAALDLEKPDLNLEAHARHVCSVAWFGLGDLDQARRAADRGLALLEAIRDVWHDQGLEFLARRRAYYRHRLDLAVAAGDPGDAWGVLEASRAQSLLEHVAVRARRPDGDAGREHGDAMVRARRALLAAVRQLDGWEPAAGEAAREDHEARVLERRRILRDLQNAEHQAAGLGPSVSELGLGEASALLDSDTVGLIFASGVDRLHVMILDPRRELEILSLDAGRRQVQALVTGILPSLDPRAGREARAGLEPRVEELSRALLAPLTGKLGGFRRLAIVADAPLDRLPFEILRRPATGRALVKSHEIAYLPSFSVLGALGGRVRACAPPESELLAMGDPVFGPGDRRWPDDVAELRSAEEAMAFRRLPATATEVARVARQVAGAEAVTGKAATRERLLAEAPRHRVIHLASHASSNAQIPERSKIALSCIDAGNVPVETCDVYFADVLNLELCGQTVVLSACRTAGGVAVEGEGVLGLPWAFLRAGASTVVASLWQVTDEATAELMSAFHGHLRGGMNPAGALRQAKLALIKRGDPPSTWAPFVMLGDWRT